MGPESKLNRARDYKKCKKKAASWLYFLILPYIAEGPTELCTEYSKCFQILTYTFKDNRWHSELYNLSIN